MSITVELFGYTVNKWEKYGKRRLYLKHYHSNGNVVDAGYIQVDGDLDWQYQPGSSKGGWAGKFVDVENGVQDYNKDKGTQYDWEDVIDATVAKFF